jgi:hypothetical protein
MPARALPRPRRTALAARRTALCTALFTTVALGLTACGPSSSSADAKVQDSGPTGPFAGQSGPEIVNRAVTATKAATSLTLDVNINTADGPMKAYMATDTNGRCTGTLSVGPAGTAELIRTGDTVYMRFDEAFLREQGKGEPAEETEAVLKLLKGRWMQTDASAPEAEDSLELCDLDSLLAEIEANDTEARRGGESTVDGKKALILTESDSEATYTIYVATEGEPYLLKVEQKGGEEPGTMTFSDYNKPVRAKKPAAKSIVDLDNLGEN